MRKQNAFREEAEIHVQTAQCFKNDNNWKANVMFLYDS